MNDLTVEPPDVEQRPEADGVTDSPRHRTPSGRDAGQAKGDRRRAALLSALEEHLHEGSLESINIAELSRRAGVTRSAFYFYFENKAAALGALMSQMYEDSIRATGQLTDGGTPAENIEATIRSLFESWDRHRHLYRAMLEARGTSATVRELWESDRDSFVPLVAAMITGEREAGRAPSGPAVVDAAALASVLLELNDRMLERLALGGPLSREQLVATVVHVWLTSIYGSAQ